jgi:hypothetical protein
MKKIKDHLPTIGVALLLLLTQIIPNCAGKSTRVLEKQIKSKDQEIAALREEIQEKNLRIVELTSSVREETEVSRSLIDSLNSYIRQLGESKGIVFRQSTEIATLKAELNSKPSTIYIDTCMLDANYSEFVSLADYDSLYASNVGLKTHNEYITDMIKNCEESLANIQEYRVYETSRIFEEEGYKTDLAITLQGKLSNVQVSLNPYNQKQTKQKYNTLIATAGFLVSENDEAGSIMGALSYLRDVGNNQLIGVTVGYGANNNYLIGVNYGFKF